jgi:hypothetical protein
VRGNEREAQRALTALLHEADEGKLAASASITVSEVIDRRLDLVETDLTATTIDGYRHLVRHIEPGLGHTRGAPQGSSARSVVAQETSTVRRARPVLWRAIVRVWEEKLFV